MTRTTDPNRPRQRRALRAGVIGLSLLVTATLGPTAGAGSLDAASSVGSSDGGSVSAGSTVPESLQAEVPPLPELRDDITAPEIVGEKLKSPQWVRFTVASPALRRTVGVDVLLPKDNSEPRPSIYALEGVDARETSSDWAVGGGARDFFADKNVNVVMINGGVSSIYSDWENIDPGVGLHKWETFIVDELPPLLDARLKTNGAKSLLGLSMGAQGAMMLAHRHPGMYKGIAAMSGCYSTTDDVGRMCIQQTISSRGGNPANIWGEIGGQGWADHDTVRHAEALRGMDIYVSSMTGIPGRYETPESDLFNRVVIGGPIEAVSRLSTLRLQSTLKELDIPATFEYHATGVHAWNYWKDELPDTWPTLARSLGLSA